LYTTLEAVRVAAVLVQPVMPESAGRLLDLLGQDAARRDFTCLTTRIEPGTALPEPAAVFPRYEG
ncbi:MAG: methionine--tRNA ligase, partial [Mycobacterium sp.]|nr:methionine--tRNA ligase [Mycobacterium sp.]